MASKHCFDDQNFVDLFRFHVKTIDEYILYLTIEGSRTVQLALLILIVCLPKVPFFKKKLRVGAIMKILRRLDF